MWATRDGVLRRPSRRGSSPTAARISWMARSIRAVSTLIGGSSAAGRIAGVSVDGPEVAESFADVEAVADHEIRGDMEPDVAQVEGGALLSILDQKGTYLEAGRAPGQEVPLQIVEGQATVDDVLHHQHVAVGQVDSGL